MYRVPKSDKELEEKFIQVFLLDFYKLHLPEEKYSALFMMPLLGTTYICGQIFPHMKHTKNKIRTKISDERVENILHILTICIKPDIDELISKAQAQCSLKNFHIFFKININIFSLSMY